MNFEHSEKTKNIMGLVSNFIETRIKPREQEYADSMISFRESGNPWQVPNVLYELKKEAGGGGSTASDPNLRRRTAVHALTASASSAATRYSSVFASSCSGISSPQPMVAADISARCRRPRSRRRPSTARSTNQKPTMSKTTVTRPTRCRRRGARGDLDLSLISQIYESNQWPEVVWSGESAQSLGLLLNTRPRHDACKSRGNKIVCKSAWASGL